MGDTGPLTCKRCQRRFTRASLWRSRYWPIPGPMDHCLPCYELLMSAGPEPAASTQGDRR